MFSLILLEAVGRGLVTISFKKKDKNYFLGKNYGFHVFQL